MEVLSIEIVPSADITLEGRLHLPTSDDGPPRGAVVVCHPHPLYGGDMNNSVVAAIANALVERGIAALRFNFRGVGNSGGSYAGGGGEQEDALSALRSLSTTDAVAAPAIGLAGYSFGGGVALAAAPHWPGLAALALISPAVPGDGPDEGYEGLTMPTLVMTGEADMFASVERIQALAASLPGAAETFIAPRADHFWWGAETSMAERIGDFFVRAFGR